MVRKRSKTSIRFIDPQPFQIQKKTPGEYFLNTDYIWLANQWFEKNDRRIPTRREIMDGLILEAQIDFEQNNPNLSF